MTGGSHKEVIYLDVNSADRPPLPSGPSAVFLGVTDKTLMAYEMDRKEVCVICNLGYDCSKPYLPYVPLFLEALADEQ